jgi:hypothetical protein
VVSAVAVVLCGGLTGLGAWIWFGPGTGCRTARPDGITRADLAGAYRTSEGGTLVLDDVGGVKALGIRPPDQPTLDGSGNWDLRATSDHSDIRMIIGTAVVYVDIGGSRRQPFLYLPADGQPCGQYRFTRA